MDFTLITIYFCEIYNYYSSIDHSLLKVSSLSWLGWFDVLPIPPMFWIMILILHSLSPSLRWWPQSPQQLLLVFVSFIFVYLSEVIQEDACRAQGPGVLLLVSGSVSFWVIRSIVFSISAILDFRVSSSDNSDALASPYLLRVPLISWVINDVASFTFDALMWPVAVEAPRYASLFGYKLFPIKEVLSPRNEILSPAGSRSSDALPSSDIFSSWTASCVSPNVMEGCSDGDILKPDGGAVFVRACIFLPIWRDQLAMVVVSSYLPCACAKFLWRSASLKFPIELFNAACGYWYKCNDVVTVPLNMPSISYPLCSLFGSVKIRCRLSQLPIVALSIPDLVMKFLGLISISSEIIKSIPLMTWVASTL